MSQLRVTTLNNASNTGTANITLDASGNATVGNTLVMGSSFKRNKIINGDMRVDQRNAGASVTFNDVVFPVDRFRSNVSQSSKLNAQQNAGSITPPAGFTNYLGLTSSSAYSVGPTDYFNLCQFIEGYNVADLAWGTANAKTITLSFWVYSSLTGTFGGCVSNSATNRCYVYSYTIGSTQANQWLYQTVTIPGCTDGVWNTTNGQGILLLWGLGNGSSTTGAAGSWGTTFYRSVNGQTSIVGTNGATFYITGVQLETGSIATPYERQIYSEQLAQCQRYYYRLTPANSVGYFGPAQIGNSTDAIAITFFPVPMRTTPSALEQTGTAGDYKISQASTAAVACTSVPAISGSNTSTSLGVTVFKSTSLSGTGGQASACMTTTGGVGYLGWSAEL